MLHINEIIKKLGIPQDQVILYGNDKAKVKLSYFNEIRKKENGRLVLVTAITPTKAGEGKTTTVIGLVDGLNKIGRKAVAALREPSLGPVFGVKGGATGGGLSSIVPSEDIDLHFTGDLHALTSSINLISAIIDNHIFQGNQLNINPNDITRKRALDMNDRALRNVIVGIGDKNGIERKDHFEITVASEMMAVLCLAKNEEDFLERVRNIIVAYTYDKNPITIRDLRISKSILKLMKYALNPNIVQTLEGNPVFVHGGPFANIAHGCNSIIATNLALKTSPIVVTEAGFAADLGAEKFLDIKCRVAELEPSAIVLVATIRALKLHGGAKFDDLDKEDLESLKEGSKNLLRHAENLKKYNVPLLICINKFKTDTEEEIKLLESICKENYLTYEINTSYLDGGDGALNLAEKVCEILDTKKSNFKFLYPSSISIKEKIEKICKEIYRAKGVKYESKAIEKINEFEKDQRIRRFPICVAKTQSSFSDNPKLLNAPNDFEITIKDISLKNGAEFIVVYAGNIMTMPGLPKIPLGVQFEDEWC